jgi:predicted NAD-dependent protein-ADP-ribosyltransferase YbiA (DUF1768 family)
MTIAECAIGKELNPKTCRFIKACRKGYTRNKDFKCVKSSNTNQISKKVVTEKVKLLKDLFSNSNTSSRTNSNSSESRNKEKKLRTSSAVSRAKLKEQVIKGRKTVRVNSNGLENSPPSRLRKTSKHLKKTVKFHPSIVNDVKKKTPFELQIEEFIRTYGTGLKKLNWGQIKNLGRKFGMALTRPKEKSIFRNMIIDYIDTIKSPEDEPKIETSGTIFMFYSKSSDVSPGKGKGEKIAPDDKDKFNELSKIKDWRKKLSNFWIAPFNLHDKRWASVEHYYQGSKFKGTPDFYNQFSLDSGSELSKDPVLAKAAGGKTGLFKGKRIRPKEIVIDSNFFENKPGKKYRRSDIEMNEAQNSKFLQNKELSVLLLLTKNAQLVHYQRGGPLVIFENLMRLRSDILKGGLRI